MLVRTIARPLAGAGAPSVDLHLPGRDPVDETRLDDRTRPVLTERAAIAKAETMQQQVLLCTSIDCDAAGDPAGALGSTTRSPAASSANTLPVVRWSTTTRS